MKYLLLFLLFALTAPVLNAQNKAVREFIREHRRGEENFAITVPGFLISLAGSIGGAAAEEPEEKLAFRFARRFGTVRVLTFDTDDFNTPRDLRNLFSDLEVRHDYETWATVRGQGGEHVQLSVKMRREEIRELLVVVSEPDEHRAVLVTAEVDITAEELGEFINEIAAVD